MSDITFAVDNSDAEMKMKQNSTFSPQPGALRVIRRNGKVVPYDASKIAVALTKAFLATTGQNGPSSESIHAKVTLLVQEIDERFKRRLTENPIIHIEDIQDQVEREIAETIEERLRKEM